MTQKPITAFFAPCTTATASHKRTASSPPSTTKESAAKISKSTNPSEEIEGSTKPSLSESTKEDEQPPLDTKTLTLVYHKGDIFAAPPQSLLIHACNTQGSWGAGIASAFRARYPAAYKIYRDYCVKTHNPVTNPIPTGTCLLIPPCETSNGKPKHWIGCLFTSAKYGKAKDTPTVILQNTERAMTSLLEKVKEVESSGDSLEEFRMCMINSGKFGVPWKRTVEVLEKIAVEGRDTVEVWSID